MAARDDILEKVKKSRQEAEQRIKESNKKAEADRQKSQEAYRESTSRETQQAASYMKDYSSPSRAGNDIASYTEKRKKATRWYKGDAPTEAETIAYSVKVGQQDKEKGREIYNLYQQAKADGHWAETYDKATSQYMTALGLTADQVNDDFFAANANLFDYGVTTAAGNLSTAKRNGAEALLAADLKGLYDDYQKTKALQAEQEQAMKEAKYWMAQGLTDDEIKAKLDIGGANSKYKNLYKAIEKTATGEYEPTTAPIQLLTSYGVDGMLYSLRNPDSSTGDYLLDAVQREMGRGVKGPEASDSRRNMTSASYAPYAVGMAGMDEYGIKYNRTSFDRDWLNSPEGLAVRNNPETTKDYAAIWEAVENTETYKAAVDEFNTDVRAMIEAGASPEEIFSSEMLDDYPEVKKLYEAQQKGMPLKTASAIDFDISAMYDEADKAYKANVGKISSEAYDTDVSAKLGTPSTRTTATAGTQTQTAEQMRVARSIFAPYATPSELNVFKTIGPSYGDTKGAVLNGITNGTSGEDQAYLSAMDAADMYAAEFYLPSVQKMNSLNREKELFDKYEAFLAEWEPRLAKEGPGLMGTDEFKAAQAEIEAAEAVWDKYDGSPDELNAAIENEKKIQQNIDRKYGDAQLLNKNGITGLSVKPMLDFAAQFESFVPGRYADTEWGARMSNGESWDVVSKDMEKAKVSNDQLLLMIDTTLKQAEKFGINKEYTAGLERAKEALLEENQLIDLTSARGNEDYSSRIAAVDGMDIQQAVASADVNLLPDRIMMAVFSPDTLASKMTGNTMYEELALAPRMTEQEVNDYKYYLAESPEKAAEYYNALTPMLRVRAAQEMEEQAASDVDTIGGGIGASIASVLVNTAQGFMLPSMVLKSAAGEEIDPYSIEFLPSLYSQTARSEIKGNIKGKFGEGSWQEKALNFAYDAVMTGADSTAAAMVGGGVGGLAIQSSSAAMSTLMDVKMRGGTDAQAWEMAGITAAAEAASEYLPMENLSKMMSKGVKSGFKTELLKQIASDAPGEMLSELVGSVSDQVIMQELSNWEASYNQYVASGLSDEEARKQADLDVWKGIGYAGLLSVGTSAGSVTMAAGIGKINKTLFKSRAETVLSEATAKGASKADQTATVSAAMESMGVDPVEADAAAQAMASVDPNAAATVQSILVHTEDPAVVDAIRLGSVLPGSQTGKALTFIQQEGATDENVQSMIDASENESDDPDIQSQYDSALTASVEAMASVNAMVSIDNTQMVELEKEAESLSSTISTYEFKLKVEKERLADSEASLVRAQKAFRNNPADTKAKTRVLKLIDTVQRNREEVSTSERVVSDAKTEYKALRDRIASEREKALTAARQAAQPVVQETMAQREQRQAETAMQAVRTKAAETVELAKTEMSNASQTQGQSSENIDPDSFIQVTPEHTAEQRAEIEAYHGSTNAQMLEAAERYKADPGAKNTRVLLSEAGEREAAEIQSLTGLDVTGYTHTADKNFFRHVEDRHGENGAHDMSMKNLSDVARVGWVIENHDQLEVIRDENGEVKRARGYLDKNREHMPLIQYTKQLDGTAYVVEAVGDNDWKRIWLVSAYMQKNSPANNSQSKTVTQTPHAGTSLGHNVQNENASPVSSIVSETAENVNTESSEVVAKPSQDLGNYGSGIVPPGSEGRAQQPSGRTGISQFAAQTGQNTTVLSDSVKNELRESPYYQKTTQKGNVDKAISAVETEGYETRRNKLLDGATNLYTPEGQAEAFVLARIAKENGDASGESAIAFKVKESGTLLGQSLAMRQLYVQMTPEGKQQFVQRIVDQINDGYSKKGKDITVSAPDWLAERLEIAKGDEEATERVLNEAYAYIAEQMPPDWKDRLNAWRYTAMLANPRTHIRNVVGNAAFVPVIAAKNKVAALLELNLDKSERTKSLGPIRSEYKEFARSQLESVRDMLTGGGKHSPMDEIQANRRSFNNSVLEWVSKGNGKALEDEDAFFLNNHFVNAFAGFLQARGADINNLDKATLNEGLDYAINEAQKATYRDASEIADKISKLSRELSNSDKLTSQAAGLLVEGALPFKKTPINVMKRGIEYSPVGLLTTLATWESSVRKGSTTQSERFDRLASGLTGTALAIVGGLLYKTGALKLKLDDPEDELEKLQGSQEYSIELFGKSVTIDWLSPSAMPLFVGGAIAELMSSESEELNLNTFFDALMNIAEPVFNLSMLDGVNTLLSAASYSENGVVDIAMRAAEGYVGQFVPTVLGAVARTFDSVRRTTYTEKTSGIPNTLQYLADSTINKIPGLSQTGQPYLNAWGEEDITDSFWQRVIENFISPGYINNLDPDTVEQHLMELFDATGEAGLIPKTPQKYFTAGGERVDLTGEQYEQLTKERGQTAKRLHEELFANPDFLSMPAEYQVDALGYVWDYSTTIAKSHIADGVSVSAWMEADDPVAEIMNKAKDKMVKDQNDAFKNDLYSAIDSGDAETAATYVAGLIKNGVTAKSLKNSATSKYKKQYKQMYEDGDVSGMRELEKSLILLNIGYRQSEFTKWLD